MTGFAQLAENALWNLFHRLDFVGVIDILIVAIIIYEMLMLTRHTRGGAVLKGVVLFVVVTLISRLLNLTALNWLLSTIIKNGAIVLIILFQPELRKALEQVGRGTAIFRSQRHNAEDEQDRIINEIVLTMKDLSRRKVGALIVFERKTGLKEFVETGTPLASRISAPLLENIFEPKTPLHDGAVIVHRNEILAAACILPVTENRAVSRELGTRHRAAIGITETSDALVFIVSEETGTMSIAEAGKIIRPVSEKDLRRELRKMYAPPKSALTSFLQRHADEEENT